MYKSIYKNFDRNVSIPTKCRREISACDRPAERFGFKDSDRGIYARDPCSGFHKEQRVCTEANAVTAHYHTLRAFYTDVHGTNAIARTPPRDLALISL